MDDYPPPLGVPRNYVEDSTEIEEIKRLVEQVQQDWERNKHWKMQKH